MDMAFTSRLILMPEHNWGLSTGQYLKNPGIYTPEQVRAARLEKPEFQKMDDEWTAKRRNVDIAVLTLPPVIATGGALAVGDSRADSSREKISARAWVCGEFRDAKLCRLA